VAQRLGWPKVAVGVLRSKMTKGNWVGGPNARLDRTADSTAEKIMVKIMRWDRKIGEGILAGKNRT
jgi:hypothetical protein